jgi:hypothetical protein
MRLTTKIKEMRPRSVAMAGNGCIRSCCAGASWSTSSSAAAEAPYGPRSEVKRRATYPGSVWTYDFVEDRNASGGKLRILLVNEFTREERPTRSRSLRPWCRQWCVQFFLD